MRNLSQSNISNKGKKIHAKSQPLALLKESQKMRNELILYKNRQNWETQNRHIQQKIIHQKKTPNNLVYRIK